MTTRTRITLVEVKTGTPISTKHMNLKHGTILIQMSLRNNQNPASVRFLYFNKNSRFEEYSQEISLKISLHEKTVFKLFKVKKAVHLEYSHKTILNINSYLLPS